MSVNRTAPFELLADCPRCKVESALVEVYDPASVACHLGVPAEARCRVCFDPTLSQDARDNPTSQISKPKSQEV